MTPTDDKTNWDDQIVALPSLEYYNNRFLEVEKAIEERVSKYYQNKSFCNWHASKTADDIEEEFLQLSTLRKQIWFDTTLDEVERAWREDFRPSLEMAREDFVRNPNCIAFDYNKISSYYNGSLVTINGMKFLALEAPLEKAMRRFFYVLLDSNTPLLVRLTPKRENAIEKCAPYWEGRLQGSQIAIPRHLGSPKFIDYLATDDWKDNSSTSTELLLEMVLQAKKIYSPAKGPIAVHCAGGVGRSGTFIAAFCLLCEIDEQIHAGVAKEDLEISIERLVACLSLQRYHMIARPSQYLNLHKLVAKYLSGVFVN